MILAGALLSSCDDDEQWKMAESLPFITFELRARSLPIRWSHRAFLGNLVAIMGDNLEMRAMFILTIRKL